MKENEEKTVDVKGVDEEYIKLVEQAIKGNENFDIPNSTLAHAVYLSQNLIAQSENNVKIFTGELYEVFCKKIENALEYIAKKFSSQKDHKIRILVWEKITKHATLESFHSRYSNVVEIKSVNQPHSDKINHFLVSDSKRYRIEDPHTKEDLKSENVRGRANFNNPDTAKALNDIFDDIWTKAS